MAAAGRQPAGGEADRFGSRRGLPAEQRRLTPAPASDASSEPCACSSFKSGGGRILLAAWEARDGPPPRPAAAADGGGGTGRARGRREMSAGAAAGRRRRRPQSPEARQRPSCFEHHPDDVGWYIRRYRVERARLASGPTGCGGQPTDGPNAAECATWSSALRTQAEESIARSRNRKVSRWVRLAAASELGSSSASISEPCPSDRVQDLLQQKAATVDHLVEKLMRRQFKAGRATTERKSPSSEHPESRPNAKVQSVGPSGSDEVGVLGKWPAAQGCSSGSKTSLPTTKIDLLERFGLGASAQADRDRSSTDNQAVNKNRSAAESRYVDLPYAGIMPGRQMKARTLKTKKAADHDGAAAAAATAGDFTLAIALDTKPFQGSQTRKQICSQLTAGDQRKSNSLPRRSGRADSRSSSCGSLSGDRRFRRRPHLLGKLGRPLDNTEIESEKSILLNVLARSTAGYYLRGDSVFERTEVEELTGRVAQAGLVDYSGYWAVQSRDAKYCALQTPLQEPKLR